MHTDASSVSPRSSKLSNADDPQLLSMGEPCMVSGDEAEFSANCRALFGPDSAQSVQQDLLNRMPFTDGIFSAKALVRSQMLKRTGMAQLNW